MYFVIVENGQLVIKPMSLAQLAKIDITQVKYRSRSGVKAQQWVDQHPIETVFDPSRLPVKIDGLAVLSWDE